MKNQFNTLRKYIFENTEKEYRKETVDGLFRSILEPLISNQKLQSCVLFRLLNTTKKESLIKRLEFSGAKIYSFSEGLSGFKFENNQKSEIWGKTEFVVILGQRYSVALIWDYTSCTRTDYTSLCLYYNSKIITDIAKVILDNSTVDFKEELQKYIPDRRENLAMNQSINFIVDYLNDKNEEIIFSEQEKKNMVNSDDTLKTAEIVSEKAKFIAHEIKNNLSIINLYSKIAEKRFAPIETDEETKNSINNSLKNVTNASENVSSLIGDLRCLSSPYKTELNLKNLILNTVMMCEEKANRAGVSLVVSDLNDIELRTDKTKFQCALTNIIFNAIEACSNGCSVCIDCFIQPKKVNVFVKNNGEPIPKAIQDKIFEQDFTTKPKGNGIGLAMCKKQMQLIKGDINLVHSNNIETLFEIVLPVE